jgi:ADP-L-glycero-D-manno-heptose 6-epimerase
MIGSNIAHALTAAGFDNIIAVDDLRHGDKFRNLRGARISDYFDQEEFYGRFARRELGKIAAVFHQGACSDTMERDGRLMLRSNYRCSKDLLDACQLQGVRLMYASSAAIYGNSATFVEQPPFEQPLNVYGYSKLLFDDVVRRVLPSATSQVVGLRYFNVYGPREQHKGRMASVIHHFTKQMKDLGKVKLFGGTGGYGDGEQRRDFVYVRDLARLNMFFAQIGPYASKPGEPAKIYRGLANAGSGKARTFNDVARSLMTVHGECPIEYIPFPADLEGRYQHFTEADLTALRALGYDGPMTELETGITETYETLAAIEA